MPAMYKTEEQWYKMDLERYNNMPIEEKEKIYLQINDLEEKYIEQLTRIRKLKVFFRDAAKNISLAMKKKEIK